MFLELGDQLWSQNGLGFDFKLFIEKIPRTINTLCHQEKLRGKHFIHFNVFFGGNQVHYCNCF